MVMVFVIIMGRLWCVLTRGESDYRLDGKAKFRTGIGIVGLLRRKEEDD